MVLNNDTPAATTCLTSSKKRRTDEDVSGDLFTAFEREAKRSKRGSSVDYTRGATTSSVKAKESASASSSASQSFKENSPPPTFLRCHLMMLQSLYTRQDEISPNIWKLIDQFLLRRRDLLASSHSLNELSELVAESKSITQQPPLSAPLKRSNTSLKSETKTSFSFTTQSQQIKVQSLSLNSPAAMAMKYEAISPFYKVNLKSAERRGTMSTWNRSVDHVAVKKFNSMNLVTSLLSKTHKTQVDITNKEREPFMPLLEHVKFHIASLEQEMKALKANQDNQYDLRDMTEDAIRNMLTNASDSCRGKEMSEVEFDKFSIMKSRLGLWKILASSLESVICR